MNNIVFYCHKVSFIRNWINTLSPYLNCNIYVFHVNSLDKEKVPETNVNLVDISNYSYKHLIKLLDKIQPQKVVFLGFKSLMELLLLRICKRKSYRAIYLEHGLYTKDTSSFNRRRVSKNISKTLIKYFNFLSKYAIFILEHGISELIMLYKAFFKTDYSLTKFDKALFFGSYGFKKLNNVFRYNNEDVVFCGYPLFKDTFEKNEKKVADNRTEVLYVHQPFILNDQTTIHYTDEKKYIENIVRKLKTKNSSFTILLHPREDINRYRKYYHDTDIKVVQSPNNIDVFLNKAMVLGHYSTALLYPLYFNIPTITLDYPGTVIDNVFEDYCLHLNSQKDFEFDFDRKSMQNKKDIQGLIGSNNTFESIANLIMNV